ncbi:MAG: fatty acid desaturase [Desmonostoc vinosum HA7617-LM4]|nr:fatty acid desaturase [Desmonostoc vinosum HA7617-LM4]
MIASSKTAYNQTIKLFVASLTWLIYLFFLPYIYASVNIFAFGFMLFPGVYILCLLALFMHECWHEYLPGVHNHFFYSVLSWMILLDPQVFNIVHPYHHSQVNTYRDIEFHPLGEIKNQFVKAVYNFCEIFLGSIFVVTITTFKIAFHPKLKKQYSFGKLIISILMWTIIWGGIGYSSHLVFGVTTNQVFISYLLICWMGSVVIHHNELIEHGNLIVEGNLGERNLKTRNLNPSGILERFFLFITHNDSREHTLHHSMSKIYTRPFFQKNPMLDKIVYISFDEYLVILKDMLTGKRSAV